MPVFWVKPPRAWQLGRADRHEISAAAPLAGKALSAPLLIARSREGAATESAMRPDAMFRSVAIRSALHRRAETRAAVMHRGRANAIFRTGASKPLPRRRNRRSARTSEGRRIGPAPRELPHATENKVGGNFKAAATPRLPHRAKNSAVGPIATGRR